MTKPTSLLRQRMIDDMKIRSMSMNTQDAYIRAVAKFSAFHRQSPNRLGLEHLRDYQLHLLSSGPQDHFNLSEVERVEVLLRYDAHAAGHSRADFVPSSIGFPARRSRTRGGRALPKVGARLQDANGLHHDLLGLLACLQGRRVDAARYR